MGAENEIHLFRIIQEAITNAIRHGRARRVEVEITFSPDKVKVAVWDDGKGFEVKQVFQRGARPSGVGLLGMKERVTILNGPLEIQSETGKGTLVTVEVPSKGGDRPAGKSAHCG